METEEQRKARLAREAREKRIKAVGTLEYATITGVSSGITAGVVDYAYDKWGWNNAPSLAAVTQLAAGLGGAYLLNQVTPTAFWPMIVATAGTVLAARSFSTYLYHNPGLHPRLVSGLRPPLPPAEIASDAPAVLNGTSPSQAPSGALPAGFQVVTMQSCIPQRR